MSESEKRRKRPEFATTKEIADLYEVHERTVRRWCIDGDLLAELTPGGGQWRIHVGEDGAPVRR